MDAPRRATTDMERVRQSRVVLAPLGWCQVCQDDWRATVTNKSGHRGERGISRNTIAQGMPMLGFACGECLRVFLPTRKAVGAAQASGIPCALPSQEGVFAKLGRASVAGM
jgi:hypothetical protein